jgi:hypothetical protein
MMLQRMGDRFTGRSTWRKGMLLAAVLALGLFAAGTARAPRASANGPVTPAVSLGTPASTADQAYGSWYGYPYYSYSYYPYYYGYSYYPDYYGYSYYPYYYYPYYTYSPYYSYYPYSGYSYWPYWGYGWGRGWWRGW